jgi:hypothetical protein
MDEAIRCREEPAAFDYEFRIAGSGINDDFSPTRYSTASTKSIFFVPGLLIFVLQIVKF